MKEALRQAAAESVREAEAEAVPDEHKQIVANEAIKRYQLKRKDCSMRPDSSTQCAMLGLIRDAVYGDPAARFGLGLTQEGE